MKYRELTPNEIEAYNIGYKVGNRQIVITDIEWESDNEHKIYRKGYMAGLMDYKRNVSKVSNVSNVEIETSTTSITPTTPIGISISKGNMVKDKFNENSIIYVNGQYFDEFPPESIPLLKKYWTDEKIERIRKDITCKPDHETTISKLLLTYPSDQIDIDAEFEKFWNAYTPVKTTDGRAVNKGSRKETFTKYSRIIKSGVKPADILKGLNAYLTDCRNNNRFTCGATVFLNQERWKDDYNTTTIIAQQPQPTMPHMSLKDMKEMQKMAEIQKILNGEQ